MNREYELEVAITQENGAANPQWQYLVTDFDTYVLNPFWDGVTPHDFSEGEEDEAIND
tara:strand:- start:299 stop:472 length:174 start_codon:yes stop_codon:yes gene_type:complete